MTPKATVGRAIAQTSLQRFILVGVLVLALENVIVWTLLHLVDNYVFVRAIATIMALLLSYVLNTSFSFRSTHSIRRFFLFTAGVSLGLAVTYLVSLWFYYYFFSSSRPLLATNIGAAVAATANYLYQRHVTYAKRR